MKIIRIFIAIFFIMGSAFGADVDSVLILCTRDLHGHLKSEGEYAGFARIASYFKRMRIKRPDVLILDAGDCISGTPVATIFKGEPIFEVMSAMGYDVGVIGNHEFDHGWKMIETFKKIATFPLLSANAYSPDNKLLGDAPTIVLDIDGVVVGIIGVITESTPNEIIKTGNEGIRFQPVIQAVKAHLPILREKCDLLIVLAHVGFEGEKRLASSIDGIDLIVGGHTHPLLTEPVKIGNTYIFQAGEYGSHIGKVRIKIDIDEKKVIEVKGELISAFDLPPPDKDVQNLVEKWERQVSKKVDFMIATSNRTWTESEMKRLFEKTLKESTGADFGYYNIGGIRDKIYKGPVTVRHIWNIEPFGNTIVKVIMKGRKIEGTLKKQLDKQNIIIEPDREYIIATNNFVAEHADRYIGEDLINVENTNNLVRDAVIEYIKKNGIEL
jgi:2',3'-cyclic-nucleotide 2'-phosphodiesterase (5'-nucleotidase family)